MLKRIFSGKSKEPIDVETLKRIQERAKNYPDLATGMISVSRVSKDLYNKNKRDLILNESLWSDRKVTLCPELPKVSLPLFGDAEGLLLENGMKVKIPVTGQDIAIATKFSWILQFQWVIAGNVQYLITKSIFSSYNNAELRAKKHKVVIKYCTHDRGLRGVALLFYIE